ncbi:MAG: CDP-alcohol phosphatidyltransferase family protein [Verrucomicrobiota bacterium]
MTTANKITILRILLVPFFVVQLLYYFSGSNELDRLLAMLAFTVAAILDGVDGYIARRYNQKSELGTILDPMADKLLLVSGLGLLSLYEQHLTPKIPTWLTAVVFSRDIILMLGMGVIYYTCGKIKVVPRLVGKVATCAQMVTVGWAMLKWDALYLHHVALLAAIATAISGLLYLRDGIKQLSQSPSSLPDRSA